MRILIACLTHRSDWVWSCLVHRLVEQLNDCFDHHIWLINVIDLVWHLDEPQDPIRRQMFDLPEGFSNHPNTFLGQIRFAEHVHGNLRLVNDIYLIFLWQLPQWIDVHRNRNWLFRLVYLEELLSHSLNLGDLMKQVTYPKNRNMQVQRHFEPPLSTNHCTINWWERKEIALFDECVISKISEEW